MQTTVTTVGAMVLTMGYAVLTGQPIQKPDILNNLAMAVGCGLLLAIPVIFFRFSVSASGIKTFNTFGRWRNVGWDEIARVEPVRYNFLPHLRLTVDGVRLSYWLPLLLSEPEAFREAVGRNAGPAHPLFLALPTPAKTAARVD